MFCRNCGIESNDSSPICSICGKNKYEGKDYCPNCGHYCLSNEQTCFYCNTSLEQSNSFSPMGADPQMPPPVPPVPPVPDAQGNNYGQGQTQYAPPPEFDVTLKDVNGSVPPPAPVAGNQKICCGCGLHIDSTYTTCPVCGKDPDTSNEYCGTCGSPISEGLDNCPGCGSKLKKAKAQFNYQNNYPQNNYQPNNYSHNNNNNAQGEQKDFVVTLLLCIFLGPWGAHRFYTGHTFLGVLYLLSCGSLGIFGMIIDLILLITDSYRDKNGNKLKK